MRNRTPEQLARKRAHNREYMRKYSRRPEVKLAAFAYARSLSRKRYNAEYYASHKEYHKQAHAAWRVKNISKDKARKLEWRRINLAELQRKAKARYWENPEACRIKCSAYKRAHPGINRAQALRWAKAHPDYTRAVHAKRRAAKRHAVPPWLTGGQWRDIRGIYAKAVGLTQRTGTLWVVDHIYPLVSTQCSGLHVPWNLQVIPATVNIRKSNKMPGRC